MINTIDFKHLPFFWYAFLLVPRRPWTSGCNLRRKQEVQDLYMELLRNLRFELPPPQISDTFDGENDGHFLDNAM